MKKVLVLGCTGSIGTNTLDIVRHMPEKFQIVGLTAYTNLEKLKSLAEEFGCAYSPVSVEGTDGIRRLIDTSKPDIVLNGIAGSAGLEPSCIVLEAGIDLALANKETIVMAGTLIQKLAAKRKCHILPVDSEHSAIFNLIERCGAATVESVIITASGGPFRTLSGEKLAAVTVADALNHPTWNMGKKITIDSATLANKGLEVIEASRLFHIDTDRIQVVIHPQSLIHSLVRTRDGELYAQISEPDMKHPIFSALTWPDVCPNYMKPFDLFDHEMTFYRPRVNDFPLLGYAYEAAKLEGSYTIAYNAANEIAVQAFIDGKAAFPDISKIVRTVLDYDWTYTPEDFAAVFEEDKKARKAAEECL